MDAKKPVKFVNRRQFLCLASNDSGATALEYGLIISATGLALAAVMRRPRNRLRRTMRRVGRKLK